MRLRSNHHVSRAKQIPAQGRSIPSSRKRRAPAPFSKGANWRACSVEGRAFDRCCGFQPPNKNAARRRRFQYSCGPNPGAQFLRLASSLSRLSTADFSPANGLSLRRLLG
ncbi:hypothetical protein [Lysobacter gummosus]|uniref:hypothetical protein n=1 Tax=Lysobacter gummosus TaxID=262324 RepID=UPI00363740A8